MITPANGRVALETIEGPVEARNERGIRIGERWCNQSRYKPLELPAAGSVVRVQVDERGFIHELEVLSDGALKETSKATASFERDERIARLAVLKAAANFLGQMSQTREEVRSEHVLVLADKWLQWVCQPHD